jgi:hypothetical protein
MKEPAANHKQASVVGFEEGTAGVTPPSSSTGRQGVFLTDVIVELGFAENKRVDEAEDAARVSGKTVEQLLLDNGAIDEDQLSIAIAERSGLDHVDLARFDVDMRAAEAVSRSVAASCGAVPIAYAPNGALIVAVQDSFDSLAVRRIETATGAEVRPVIAAVSAIKRLIERLPDEAPTDSSEPEVPRLKSQRELQMSNAEASVNEEEREEEEEPPEPPPPSLPPPPPPPVADEPATEPKSDGLDSFDGLSMDLGPTVMEAEEAEEDEQEPVKAAKPGKLKKATKREDRLARELVETHGKVAELERRLEEVIDAAEDATPSSEKLRTLRRAIDEDGD